MTSLVELKQALKMFYIRYERYVNFGVKFVVALLGLIFINTRMHYHETLTSPVLVIPVAILLGILPAGFTVLTHAAFILGHLYKLSIESFAVCAVLFLMMYLLYYRFPVHDSVVVILMPLLFFIKIPYVMPIALGLLMTPLSILSMSCGIITWFFLSYIIQNSSALGTSGSGADETIGRLQGILDGLLNDRTMVVYIVTFAIVLTVVYFVRRLSVDHAWLIATGAGAVINLVVLLSGDLIFDTDISIPMMIIGTVVAVIVAVIITFFAFHLDFERVEKVQFEDDDYYYYVKAIPKVILQEKSGTVKNINRATSDEDGSEESKRGKRSSAGSGRSRSGKDKEGDSGYLTRQREESMRVDNAGARRKRRTDTGEDI